jgi:hypothetical protein
VGTFDTGGAFTANAGEADISVTLTTGTTALVIVTATQENTPGDYCEASYAVSGATTEAATFLHGVENSAASSEEGNAQSGVFFENALTAGSNTFTMEYSSNGSCTILRRELTVVPLG